MTPRPLPIAALMLMSGCGDADHAHDHDHDVDGGHERAHNDDAAAQASPVPPKASAVVGPDDFQLGTWTVRLEATAAGLHLSAKDSAGARVQPTGEVRVVLTAPGQDEERLVLSPTSRAWEAPAQAVGASGYVAVISMLVNEKLETARVTWGEVPPVAPAVKPDGAGHGGEDQDHGHGHGHGH